MTAGALLGVDFGTSNTAAALRPPDGPVRPLLFDGAPLLPSAVYAGAGGALLVGRDAVHAGGTHPERFEPNPKRAVGEGTLLLGDAEVPVTAAVAAVLRRVAAEATLATGGLLPPVVLTVPAGWGAHRRDVLRSAAALAFGRDDTTLVPEPVAAAHAFAATAGDRFPVGATVLVYDLGAGTFDASVVRRTEGSVEVLATRGLPDVGGLDVDAAMVESLAGVYRGRDASAWHRLAAPEGTGELRLRSQFWHDVRAGKEMLSRTGSTLIHVPGFDDDAPFGRERLDDLIRPLLDRTAGACRDALGAAGVAPGDLAGIFLVGGSSRIPLVGTVLHHAFGMAPVLVDQPDLAVAMGSVLAGATPAAAVPASSDSASAVPASPVPAAVPSVAPARSGPNRWRAGALVATGVVAAVLALLAAPTLRGLAEPERGKGQAATGASPSPTAGPSPSPVDPAVCLIGRWRETSASSTVTLDGVSVSLRSEGAVVDYRQDGTLVHDTGGTAYRGEAAGHTYELTFTAPVTWNYIVSGDKILYTNKRSAGEQVYKRDGKVRARDKLNGTTGVDTFVCRGDILRTIGDTSNADLVRVP